MKKFPKTPAMIGAVAGVINLVITLISLLISTINYISMGIPFGTLVSILVGSMIGVVLTGALVVTMFRGKKDMIAGICLGVNGLYALINLFSLLFNLLTGRVDFLYSNVEAIFRTAVLLLMAIDCFVDLPVDQQTKTLLFAGGMVLYYALDVLMYGIMMLSYGNFIAAIGSIIGYLLPTIPAFAANVCLALCVGSAKPEPSFPGAPQQNL